MAFKFKRGIYLISPPGIADLSRFMDDLVCLLSTSYVSLFQLRLKGLTDEKILKIASILREICRLHKVPFILNDSPLLAREIDADGVHIGKDDGGIEAAKNIMPGKIVGTSCYNKLDFALKTAESGASYVAFGAMFETTSKIVEFRSTPELISDFKALSSVPVCAIGGINSGNIAKIAAHKPDLVAVISAIWSQPDNAAMLAEAEKLYDTFTA